MNKQGKSIVYKVFAILIIFALTVSDFLFVGANFVSYAVDTVKTNSSNVEFSAYFLNQAGEKVEKIEEDISKGDLYLYVDVTVKNEGYFDGTVTINNSNFNIKSEILSQDVAEISGNKVTLNHINAGSTSTIKLAIEAIESSSLNIDTLGSKTDVVLEGQYINSKNVEKTKKVEVNGNATVELYWVSSENVANELTTEVLTNNIYKVNDEEKRIIQIIVNSKVTDNNYPVKSTSVNLSVPENVEEVLVHSRENAATNSNINFSEENYSYNKQTNTLTIEIENTDENNISWNKNVQDTFIVTYVLDKDVNLQNTNISEDSTIITYDNKELKASSNVHIEENIDGIVSYSVDCDESYIYKGKLYTGEERSYNTSVELNVDYLGIVENISINENESLYLAENSTANANITYKESKINKQEFLKIFGEEGYILVKNSNGAVIANINKDSATDENGNIVISYNSNTYNVTFETSKPASIGTMEIKNTKVIANKDYSREDVNMLTGIKESLSCSYNQKEVVEKETQIELKNTSSSASLSVGTTKLSTIEENKKVKITAVLENNEESKDLFKNPVLKITLPEQVEDVQAKCKVLYGNGLELSNATIYKENGKYVIQIDLAGEQTTYNTETIEGTTIIIYADLELDKLATNADEKITLNYTNEIASSFSDNGEESASVEIVASDGIITTNSVEEYGVETIGDQGKTDVSLELSTEAKNATISISTINNEGSDVKDVKIVGSFPTGEEDTLGARLTSGIKITSQNTNATVYYSSQENPSSDLQDSENGWSTKGSASTSKSYMIVVDEMAVGEELEAEYTLSIPENLVYNMAAEESYAVTYTNVNTLQTKSAQASTLNLTTGTGPNIETQLKAYISGEEIADGDSVNSGEIVKYEFTVENTGNATAENINIEASIPENSKYVQYQKNISEEVVVAEEEETEQETDESQIQVDEEGYYIYDYSEEETEGDDENEIGSEMIASEDYYKEIEIESGKISKTINSLEPGKKVTVSYEVKINEEVEENSTLENEIITTCEEIKDTKTLTNKITQSDISLELGMIQRMTTSLSAGNTYIYVLKVKNLSSSELSNININLNCEQFTISEIEVYGSEEEEEIELSEDNEFTIESIEKGETKQYMIYAEVDHKTENSQAKISANINLNNKKYRSNQVTENILEEGLEMSMSSANEGESVEAGEKIEYDIKVTNTGDVSITDLQIEQQISNYLSVISMTINGSEIEYLQKENEQEESLENTYTIYVNQELEKGSSLDIIVEAEVNSELYNSEDIQLTSMAESYDEELLAQTEQINHVLAAYTAEVQEQNPDYIDDQIIGDGPSYSKNEDNETSNGTSTENNGDTDSSNSGSDQDNNNGKTENQNVYTISGTAWLDENEDGKRDSDEELLSGIEVTLLDLQNNTAATATTSENGFYSLTKVPNGQYIAIFNYDTDKYMLTTYKADNIAENRNSDVENITINLNGEDTKVSSTDTLVINDNNLTNIDLGLVEAKVFDLELSKTITKVTITNSQETKTIEYDDTELAKAEIAAKYLSDTTVVIEYKIKVKNTGEVAGYAKNIVDYKPTDLTFNSSLNPDWYQSEGNLYTTSLANTKLEAGEEKELTLVLTKTMTESNTGLVNNTAEIQEDYNNLGIADTDSTPGNKQKSEDDMGSSNCIISVKTGAAVSYIALTLSIIAIIAAGAYMVSKKVLKKEIKF